MTTTFAIIPARAGSKSIRDKNIQIVGGRPLLAYSIAIARASAQIDKVFVSTDCTLYAEIAKKYGADVIMRPKDISGDDSADIEFILHFLDTIKQEGCPEPSYLVHLRPNVPLRYGCYVDGAIITMKSSDLGVTALRSVHKMSKTAYKQFEIKNGFLECVFTHSDNIDRNNIPQQGNFPVTYDANGYVDVLRVSHIRVHEKMHGIRVLGYLVPHITDIDDMVDLNYVRYEIEKDSKISALYDRLCPVGM
jgi:N-acylneuraminate cytidylyltransferase